MLATSSIGIVQSSRQVYHRILTGVGGKWQEVKWQVHIVSVGVPSLLYLHPRNFRRTQRFVSLSYTKAKSELVCTTISIVTYCRGEGPKFKCSTYRIERTSRRHNEKNVERFVIQMTE